MSARGNAEIPDADLLPEQDLRSALLAEPGICVLTGGQTGVDTVAARAALGADLPVHLVFPRGLRQEDGPITPDRRLTLRGAVLHELASGEFRHRTRTCVSLADAVILIDPAGGKGCQETQRAARDLGRPLLTLPGQRGALPGEPGEPDEGRDSSGPAGPDEIAGWIERTRARVLMIAGCRGSLLAVSGCERLAADQAAAVVTAACQRHGQLTS
jgi:hypothetical protein